MALVYQRATAKLALYAFLHLFINDLRTKRAIDTGFKTKVLLRRLKRHRGFGTPLLALCRQTIPRQDRALAIFAPVIAPQRAIPTQHVVARNQPADRICANRVTDRTRTPLRTNRFCERGISRMPAHANVE